MLAHPITWDSLTRRTATLHIVHRQKFSFIVSLKSSAYVNFTAHFNLTWDLLISLRLIWKVKKLWKNPSIFGFDHMHTACICVSKWYIIINTEFTTSIPKFRAACTKILSVTEKKNKETVSFYFTIKNVILKIILLTVNPVCSLLKKISSKSLTLPSNLLSCNCQEGAFNLEGHYVKG